MVHLLYFSVGGIKGALPLDDTMQLVRMVQPGPVDEDFLGSAGILNYHGDRIPIYSVRRLFGLSEKKPAVTDNLIISRKDGFDVALWVEETFIVQYSDIISEQCYNEEFPESALPGIRFFPDGLVLIIDIALFISQFRGSEQSVISTFQNISVSHKEHDDKEKDSFTFFYDGERTETFLSKRAENLALPEEIPYEATSIEVLTFQLVYREYAVGLKYVRESVLSREITPVPGAPEHIIGIVAVRGEIIPLIDLRVLLNIPEKGLTDLKQVIVLTDGVITFGVLADQITGITSVPIDTITPPDPHISPRKPAYIFGFFPGPAVMINAAEILADPDMIVDDSAEPYTIPDFSPY